MTWTSAGVDTNYQDDTGMYFELGVRGGNVDLNDEVIGYSLISNQILTSFKSIY